MVTKTNIINTIKATIGKAYEDILSLNQNLAFKSEQQLSKARFSLENLKRAPGG